MRLAVGPVARISLRAAVITVFAAPLVFLVLGSLRELGAPPPEGLEVVPRGASLAAFGRISDYIPLGTLVRNSLVVLVVAVPLTVVVASWAGFAIAQLPDRTRRIAVAATVATLMVPPTALWIPRFVIYREVGALDTLVPLIAPALAATTPFTVLLAYRSFRRIPPELWDAARTEGAGAFATWRRVGLPMVPATTAAVAAITAAFHWGNYVDALLYTSSPGVRTLARAVPELGIVDAPELPILLAGAALLVLPPALVVIALNRWLLRSVDVATGN
ncbi:MAG TPA: ABC transporter permease subunit [Mycobacteriales bacterium]|nr:ABC transporter permease subunit [Mycobacteriales bacterium]